MSLRRIITAACGVRVPACAVRAFSAVACGVPPDPLSRTLRLDDLRDNPGATRDRKRKGRGEGSGMGRTAGRGMKGTKARSGGSVSLGFEGGQSPLWRRTPKIGFMPKGLDKPLEPVNLLRLQLFIDQGRIDASKPITLRTLYEAGVVSSMPHGIKLLGAGADRFVAKVDVEVTQASASAIAAIEKNGGRIVAVYYSDLALRSILRPHRFDRPLLSPRPSQPQDVAYYARADKRGYLSAEVQLTELRRRLDAGVPLAHAAQIMPLFAGGPVHKAAAMGLEPVTHAGLERLQGSAAAAPDAQVLA